jgi:hypothetical protein
MMNLLAVCALSALVVWVAKIEKRITLVVMTLVALIFWNFVNTKVDKVRCEAMDNYLESGGEIRSISEVYLYVKICDIYPPKDKIK